MSGRPRLLFVSPRFLFPTDQGGKIRTTQILRGLKGGRFEITLTSPAPPGATERYGAELAALCDRFIAWPETPRSPLYPVTRLRHLVSALPVSVAGDRSVAGASTVRAMLAADVDLVVCDFLHSLVLAPESFPCRSVLFTHNVEAEIFRRHAEVAENRLKRALWQQQQRKMQSYEQAGLRRFDTVVAVSERDARAFAALDGLRNVETIPTGVDLEFFDYQAPGAGDRVVFTGAMDWQANIDGIEFFMEDIWPWIAARRPRTHVTVVGRNPAPSLVERARRRNLPVTFTGFVDDIRPHARGAAAYIIPLRVGGGTRIKAFEAMAMGIPVVSTALGVEGLALTPEEHYLRGDTAQTFAEALIRLLEDRELRHGLAERARHLVETQYSAPAVAERFEDICWRTLHRP